MMYHGRENYRRNCYMVNYTFYKNFVFVIPCFIFGIYSKFSSQDYYETYLLQIFNLVFTALPCLFYAVLDQEYVKEKFLKYP
jgi:magnesium-transporting ATPase (P-type)